MTQRSKGRSGPPATGGPASAWSHVDRSGVDERWVEEHAADDHRSDGLGADELCSWSEGVGRGAPEVDEVDADPVLEEHGVLTIDCGTCELRHTTACGDCLVSFVCDRRAGEAVVIDVAEARAIRLLGTGGLVPTSRHRRRTG